MKIGYSIAAVALAVISAALLTSCLGSQDDSTALGESPSSSDQVESDQVISDNIVVKSSLPLITNERLSAPNSSEQQSIPSSDQISPTPGKLITPQQDSKQWDEVTIDTTVVTPDQDASVALPASDSEATAVTPLQSSKSVEVNASDFRQLLRRDAIAPIYTPQFLPPRAASLNPSELVIGVSIDGESKAYPIGPLARREMVNDVIAGVPILVTW
ncbi:MAG: hypothetical protein BZY81_07175 [SAR202 cluster bacterium Io17-Chloro-G4]|nr:MAG: hypothetical protein BZY81_07175 [SAR202 cluster bacterium Io17-Chloro-G4]